MKTISPQKLAEADAKHHQAILEMKAACEVRRLVYEEALLIAIREHKDVYYIANAGPMIVSFASGDDVVVFDRVVVGWNSEVYIRLRHFTLQGKPYKTCDEYGAEIIFVIRGACDDVKEFKRRQKEMV